MALLVSFHGLWHYQRTRSWVHMCPSCPRPASAPLLASPRDSPFCRPTCSSRSPVRPPGERQKRTVSGRYVHSSIMVDGVHYATRATAQRWRTWKAEISPRLLPALNSGFVPFYKQCSGTITLRLTSRACRKNLSEQRAQQTQP